MRTAIFPGSFDPFTVGHYDVLEQALNLFDKVIVAVGFNSSKTGFFSPETRVEIIRQATANMPNVEVCTYTGLTIDICRQFICGSTAILVEQILLQRFRKEGIDRSVFSLFL